MPTSSPEAAGSGIRTPSGSRSRRPRGEDLFVLLTVARLGQIAAAAHALGTAHTTVTRRIAALDRVLGGPTLVRTPAGWELTELGHRARVAAEAIEQSLQTLASSTGPPTKGLTGPLRLAAPEGLSTVLVAPALVRLRSEHPDLEIQLISTTRPVSGRRLGVDLAVVIGAGRAAATCRRDLGEYQLGLFASPGYVARNGTPSCVQDLSEHSVVTYLESDLHVPELGRSGAGLPAPRVELQADSLFAQLSAVRAGAGIALLPVFLVPGADLVPVLPGEVSPRHRMSAVAHPDAARSATVRAAAHALAQEADARRPELLRDRAGRDRQGVGEVPIATTARPRTSPRSSCA